MGSWNCSSLCTRTYFSHMVNVMAADDPSSVVMVLTHFSQNILASAPEGLTLWWLYCGVWSALFYNCHCACWSPKAGIKFVVTKFAPYILHKSDNLTGKIYPKHAFLHQLRKEIMTFTQWLNAVPLDMHRWHLLYIQCCSHIKHASGRLQNNRTSGKCQWSIYRWVSTRKT